MILEKEFGIYKITQVDSIYVASIEIPHSKGIEILKLKARPSSEYTDFVAHYVAKTEIPYRWIDRDYKHEDLTLMGFMDVENPNELINSLDGVSEELSRKIPIFDLLFADTLEYFQ